MSHCCSQLIAGGTKLGLCDSLLIVGVMKLSPGESPSSLAGNDVERWTFTLDALRHDLDSLRVTVDVRSYEVEARRLTPDALSFGRCLSRPGEKGGSLQAGARLICFLVADDKRDRYRWIVGRVMEQPANCTGWPMIWGSAGVRSRNRGGLFPSRRPRRHDDRWLSRSCHTAQQGERQLQKSLLAVRAWCANDHSGRVAGTGNPAGLKVRLSLDWPFCGVEDGLLMAERTHGASRLEASTRTLLQRRSCRTADRISFNPVSRNLTTRTDLWSPIPAVRRLPDDGLLRGPPSGNPAPDALGNCPTSARNCSQERTRLVVVTDRFRWRTHPASPSLAGWTRARHGS